MKHHHKQGSRRRAVDFDDRTEQPAERHRGRKGRGFGARGGRPFNYGEFRLLALAMIGKEPCHGYELMKLVEERMGGSYTPSPGIIYPTLSWLEDMGYTSAEADQAGRKRYRITREGEA